MIHAESVWQSNRIATMIDLFFRRDLSACQRNYREVVNLKVYVYYTYRSNTNSMLT